MTQTFKPGQRVTIRSAAGGHTARGTARPYPGRKVARNPRLADWYVVKFDDGGRSAVHADNLSPVR